MNSSLILHLEQTEPSTKPVPGVSGRALEIPASLMPKLLVNFLKCLEKHMFYDVENFIVICASFLVL